MAVTSGHFTGASYAGRRGLFNHTNNRVAASSGHFYDSIECAQGRLFNHFSKSVDAASGTGLLNGW